jgi:hypothetical protein
MADPVRYRKHAVKYRRLARFAKSDEARLALIEIAKTWTKLAAQTESYEAVVCKLSHQTPDDSGPRA